MRRIVSPPASTHRSRAYEHDCRCNAQHTGEASMSQDGWVPPGSGGGGGGTVTTDGLTIQGTGASTSAIALKQVYTSGSNISGAGTPASPLTVAAIGGGGGGSGGGLTPANPTWI